MDRMTPQERSRLMARIRSKDTLPERLVRSLLHRMGFRFRVHSKKLPGTPDIVLPKYRVAIQVHGCFWHCHEGCKDASMPKSNTEFWQKKLARNVERDLAKQKALEEAGWRVIVVWECETKDADALSSRLHGLITLTSPSDL